MTEHEFTLVIEGLVQDDVLLDKLYAAGCSDATFGEVDHVGYGEFARKAKGFPEAVVSAMNDVESVPNLRVTRVEPDDFVTLSEIAERVDRTRESVRLLASGERGPGDFPAPVSHLRERSRLWRWSDVAAWMDLADAEAQRRARFVAALNAALELRGAGDLPPRQRKIIERRAMSTPATGRSA